MKRGAEKSEAMKMPELLVFARLLVIGFVGAEVLCVAFYLGATRLLFMPNLLTT